MESPAGNDESTVAVIGAGIIGLAIAFRLVRQHRKVVLIDRDDPGMAASYGNAGHIATEQIFPLASPGTLLIAPRLLVRRDRPLSIRREYATGILPWLLRFAWAARPASYRRGTAALSQLQARAMQALQNLYRDAGISSLLQQRGHMVLAEREKSIPLLQSQQARLHEHGIATQWLKPDAVAARAPELRQGIAGALLFTDTGHVSDPWRVCSELHKAFLAAGGQSIRAEVQSAARGAHGQFDLQLQPGSVQADKVVLAAGAWSRTLAAQLACDVPLDTERGYHVTAVDWRGQLDLPIASHERMIIMAPLDCGLRMTGFVEFGGLLLPPRRQRIETLRRHLQELMPGAAMSEFSEWMGFRPSLPDHLPVIGGSPADQDILFAFGHQHLGLTLAGVTADAVAALARGDEPALDLHPFRVNRF